MINSNMAGGEYQFTKPELLSPVDDLVAIVQSGIEAAWHAGTSLDERWHPSNPERGQELPSALVIQDYLGGLVAEHTLVLPSGTLKKHYANALVSAVINMPLMADTIGAVKLYDKTSRSSLLATRRIADAYHILRHDAAVEIRLRDKANARYYRRQAA